MNNIFFHLLTYFVIYSFLGWILESIVRTICERKIINTGFLIGPFCPIYGFGAIIMILFLNHFKNNIILLFFISLIVLSLWEYIVGVFLEKLFKTKYWDYSNHKFNYKGRICLTNSLAWGILGVLFITYIHPFIIQLLGYIDFNYVAVISIIIAIILLVDAIISTIKIKNIKTTLQKIEEINEQIKEKLLELKEKESTLTNESIQNLVAHLKIRRDKIVKHLYRRAYRLKKAFPAIDTKEFSEILNKKIELKNRKKKRGNNMIQEIYIIDDDDSSIVIFRELFKEDKEYKFISVKSEQIDIALKNIPSLIIINEDAIDRDVVGLCKQIRRDEDNTITPVIVVSSNSDKAHRMKILRESIEYYIKKPVDEEYLYYTVKNLNRLLSNNRRVSPLTGLPGNVQIHAELKKRISNNEPFSVLYLDLDNFKAYNDVYGFVKGDQIIEFTAETILRGVHSDLTEEAFVGHIGGDDFVAILPSTNCEKICQNILTMFDSQVGKFFTERDLEKGYIEVENRKGIIEQFPLTSLSIGVVVADAGRFNNILEIGEIGAQVKHAAKSVMGSSYAVDRRR